MHVTPTPNNPCSSLGAEFRRLRALTSLKLCQQPATILPMATEQQTRLGQRCRSTGRCALPPTPVCTVVLLGDEYQPKQSQRGSGTGAAAGYYLLWPWASCGSAEGEVNRRSCPTHALAMVPPGRRARGYSVSTVDHGQADGHATHHFKQRDKARPMNPVASSQRRTLQKLHSSKS